MDFDCNDCTLQSSGLVINVIETRDSNSVWLSIQLSFYSDILNACNEFLIQSSNLLLTHHCCTCHSPIYNDIIQ